MSKIAELELTGKSWKKYTFMVYPYWTDFRKLWWVYYISKRDTNRNHKKIYIWQTEDLSTRFDKHHKEACFKKHSANCVSVYVENNEKNRLYIEDDLIKNYNPPCNW